MEKVGGGIAKERRNRKVGDKIRKIRISQERKLKT